MTRGECGLRLVKDRLRDGGAVAVQVYPIKGRESLEGSNSCRRRHESEQCPVLLAQKDAAQKPCIGSGAASGRRSEGPIAPFLPAPVYRVSNKRECCAPCPIKHTERHSAVPAYARP